MTIKSHFIFSRQKRTGIFLLLLIIVILQVVYFYIDKPSKEIAVHDAAFLKFQKEVDSLRLIKLEESKPKVFPFNPNYITDYKGAMLGMSNEEIDRLLNYRKANKWINSAAQFQEVTQVSDSLLNAISPYFKFPDWAGKQTHSKGYVNESKSKIIAKQDLNTATVQDLIKVNGVGMYYAEKIIRLRNSFPSGFISEIQLQDVNGLKPEVIKNITDHFIVKTPRAIKKINLNTATVDELVTIQHIDYNLAKKIVEHRILLDGYKSLNDLTKVKGFPANKIEIIKLYLHLEKEN